MAKVRLSFTAYSIASDLTRRQSTGPKRRDQYIVRNFYSSALVYSIYKRRLSIVLENIPL